MLPQIKSRDGAKVVTGKWTKEEVERLNSYLAMGLSVPEIATRIDRAPASVHNKVHYAKMTPEEREKRRDRQERYRREYSGPVRNWMHDYAPTILSERPAPELLTERDVRFSAPLRDLSGFVFGDPPVGYSALDIRR